MWSKSLENFNPYESLKMNRMELFQPPVANTQLIFGTSEYNNFSINFYRDKPLNKFQIWLYRICFGITAKNLKGETVTWM